MNDSNGVRAPTGRWHYGHTILSLAFLTQLFSTGLIFYAFGVFLGPISEEFGWGKAETAFGFSLFSLSTILYNPLISQGIERWGAKRFLVSGVLITGLGLMSLVLIQQLWHFYALMFFLVGFGGASMGYLPTGAVINEWFIRRRSFALSVSSAGVSLGGVLVIFFGSRIIHDHGWRAGMAALAVSVLVCVLYPMTRWMVNRPEQLGLQPDHGFESGPAPAAPEDLRLWSVGEMLGSRVWWLFLAAYAVNLVSITGVLVFLKKSLVDGGYTPEQATLTFGLTALTGFLSKPGLGILGDKLSKRQMIYGALAAEAVGVTVLLLHPGPNWLWLFSLFFGLGMSANLPIFLSWIADHFGRLSFSRAAGILLPGAVVFQSFGHYLGGKLFDLSGRWIWTFVMYMLMYVLAALLSSWLPERRHMQTQRSANL